MSVISLICQENNVRLDKFLADALPQLSRAQAQKLIKSGAVTISGLTPRKNTLLRAQTVVTLQMPVAPTQGLQPEPMALDILFEDDYFLALNKPSGVVVHPAAGHTTGTLVNGLIYHCPALADLDDTRPGIVHRLDKDTSGVMVVAKTVTALNNLQTQFKNRSVEKWYIALVKGVPQAPGGTIDVPLGRHPHDRQRFAANRHGKPARTHYQVITSFEDYTLLKIGLETGRTHQIRVHLAWLGHPVVGDSVYGKRKNRAELKRQFLHAYQLTLQHPQSAETLTFQAPLPTDLQQALSILGASFEETIF